jgi:hypothetical protein
MEKIKAIFTSVVIGRQLGNSAFWKSVQGSTNGLAVLFAAMLVFFPGLELSAEAVHYISMAVAYLGYVLVTKAAASPEMVRVWIAGASALIWGLFNWYLTYATSAKVGLPAPKSAPPANPAISDKSIELNQQSANSLSTTASEDWRDEILDTKHLSDAAFAESHGLPSFHDEVRKSNEPVQVKNSLDGGKKLLGG